MSTQTMYLMGLKLCCCGLQSSAAECMARRVSELKQFMKGAHFVYTCWRSMRNLEVFGQPSEQLGTCARAPF